MSPVIVDLINYFSSVVSCELNCYQLRQVLSLAHSFTFTIYVFYLSTN